MPHHGGAGQRSDPRRTSTPGDARDDAARPKNHEWLALTTEAPLEPELPICDPHHHLWDLQTARLVPRYLLDEILADTSAGHNIVSTVFIECGAMFKPDGPEALRPVGETEFVNGIAAMSASGIYGTTRVAAGIIGTADLRLGAAVAACSTRRSRRAAAASAASAAPGPGMPTRRFPRIAPIPGRACSRVTTSAPASPSWRHGA